MIRLFDYLFEQAYAKTQFQERLWNVSQQMIENIALIIYAKHFDNNTNQNLNHWITELNTYCSKIGYDKIRKNNSYKNRYKVIYSELVTNAEYSTDQKTLTGRLTGKFRKEGFQLTSDLAKLVMQQIEKLVELLANYSDEKFQNFIEHL